MSIVAGIFISLTTAATIAWAGAGERIANIPAVRRVVDYVDGGFRIPSDKAVDALMDAARVRREFCVPDRDALMDPDANCGALQTFGEYYDVIGMSPCIAEADINEAPDVVQETPTHKWLEWIRGGYNMPTAAGPHTMRGEVR